MNYQLMNFEKNLCIMEYFRIDENTTFMSQCNLTGEVSPYRQVIINNDDIPTWQAKEITRQLNYV